MVGWVGKPGAKEFVVKMELGHAEFQVPVEPFNKISSYVDLFQRDLHTRNSDQLKEKLRKRIKYSLRDTSQD